jgi:hypothetical protein
MKKPWSPIYLDRYWRCDGCQAEIKDYVRERLRGLALRNAARAQKRAAATARRKNLRGCAS